MGLEIYALGKYDVWDAENYLPYIYTILVFAKLCRSLYHMFVKTRKITCLWQCTTQEEIFNLLFQTSYPILEVSFVWNKISSTDCVSFHIAKMPCFRSSVIFARLPVVNVFFHMCELNAYMCGIYSLLNLTVNNKSMQVALGYQMCKDIKMVVTK
jgi:hypothetical protein